MNNENELQPIFDWSRQFVDLGTKEIAFMEENLSVQLFPKGSFLLEEGKVMQNWYFCVSGCIRKFYNTGINERTTAFFTENDTVFSFSSFLDQEPADHSIQCIEDCKLIVCNYRTDKEGFGNYDKLTRIGQQRLRREVRKYEKFVAMLLTKNATERYIMFMNEHPELAQRVPQRQLASYLGIRPESLSRIRNKMAKGQIY